MRFSFFFALAMGVCAASLARAAAPLEAYGKLPSIEEARISPDGNFLAVVVTDGELRNVVIQRVADQQNVAVVKAGAKKLRDVRWAGSDHLLLTVSSYTNSPYTYAAKHEWWMAIDYNVRTHTQATLLDDGRAGMNVVAGEPQVRTVDGKPLVFVPGVEFNGYRGNISLYRIDLATDHSTVAANAFDDTYDWLVDDAGKPIAETEYDSKTKHWRLKANRGGAWTTVETLEASIETPDLLGLSGDGRTALISQLGSGGFVLRQLAPDASAWSDGSPTGPDDSIIFDPETGREIATSRLVGDDWRVAFLAPADQATWEATVRAFPGERVRLVSMSNDRRKLVVVADSPTLGPAYSLVDSVAKTARWIGPEYSALTADDIGPVEPVSFSAADGMPLSGYLTLPHGRPPTKLPLVVFPHGGPAARDVPGFDWWAQAMASRGYAVLQVNYRGSSGLGWKFQQAGFGQWGRKMQTDLSDGVRYLAAKGIIDPKRVCIVGASYGGYAALAGATLDLGVYRCAVSIAGLSSLRRLVAADDDGDYGAQRYEERYMGAKDRSDPVLKDLSPAEHADRVTIPILLIHGKDDTVVPFEHSELMRDALERAGKPVKFVVLEHEDHWLSHGDTRLQMLRATMDFLAKNNPAQ